MNRIIVVTGGAGGIGRCIVAHFASQGDSVYFIDQNQQATLTQVEKMRERGWQVTGFVGDVAEKQALEEFAAFTSSAIPTAKITHPINRATIIYTYSTGLSQKRI